MRIEKEVVEEEINTEEDLVLCVDKVVFKKNVRCRNIVSEKYRRDIDAWNIDARNIDAGFIVCEKRIKKTGTSKTICKNIITNRSTYEKKEAKTK